MSAGKTSMERPAPFTRRAVLIAALGATAACAKPDDGIMTAITRDRSKRIDPMGEAARAAGPPYANLYRMPGDTGRRGGAGYIARRAFVQITRDLKTTQVPPTQRLDLPAMARRSFAVSWLGHSAQLLHVAGRWLMLDPFLSGTAGPIAGFGPARLTPLPVAIEDLPRIDAVLISHDHYDHLDLDTVRQLARQENGPPRFLVGLGLKQWFAEAVGATAEEHDWWQETMIGDLALTFLPAQHNSGRNLTGRNRTLWGGWGVAWRGQRFYYAGDTAYVADLFRLIRRRFGAPHLASIPIGAYTPSELLRFEHLDPAEAVEAHGDLGAAGSLAVHWGTLQLGDEEPFTPAGDLAAALESRKVEGFGVTTIGAFVDVAPQRSSQRSQLIRPSLLRPVFAA